MANQVDGKDIDLKDDDCKNGKSIETENESWTSSDERSSGNEYSERMKNEERSEDEALQNLYTKRKKHHKKHKKRKKEQEKDGQSRSNESIKEIIDAKKGLEKKLLLSKVDDILDNCVSENLVETKDNGSITKEANKTMSKSGKLSLKTNEKSKLLSKTTKDCNSRSRSKSCSRSKSRDRRISRSKSHRSRSRSKDRRMSRSKSHHSRSRSKDRRIPRSKSHHSRSRSKDRRRSRSKNHRSRSRSNDRRRSRSKSRRSRSKSKNRHRSRSKSRSSSKSRDHRNSSRRSRSRSRDRYRSQRSSRSRDRRRSRSRSGHRRRSRSNSRERRRSRSRDRRRSKSKSPSKTRADDKTSDSNRSMWDVKAIAGTNIESDTVFQKVSGLRRSGIEIKYGNSVESGITAVKPLPKEKLKTANPYGKWEPVPDDKKGGLSKYMKLCQEISAKESIYEDHVVDSKTSSDEEDKHGRIHHPFISKPAPVLPPPTFNNRIPMNPAQAIMAGSMNSITGNPVDIISGPLEEHFPVSSGTDHREKENVRGEEAELPVYDQPTTPQEPINVSAVIARRIGAQQILTNNPNDLAAQKVLEECDMKLKGWTERNKKPGKFTGERGVRMDKKEIAGAIETWVRKDFFHNLMPVSGGIGMRMMQNMGWKQGTPLGKNKEGYVAPIVFDVKVGRTGLASNEERPQQKAAGGGFGGNNLPKKRLAPVQNVDGKHPVSALSEICSKKHLGQPEYTCVFEGGSSHNKTFLIKCTIQNVDYQPSVASPNKKHAKAQAALTALKILGL